MIALNFCNRILNYTLKQEEIKGVWKIVMMWKFTSLVHLLDYRIQNIYISKCILLHVSILSCIILIRMWYFKNAVNSRYLMFFFVLYLELETECLIRDANFYGLPVVTMENCDNFQFSTDYGKVLFFYGNFLKSSNQKFCQKSNRIWFPIA